MTYDELRAALLGKPGAWEDFPFGPDAAVIKVKSKMFALILMGAGPVKVNLKCDPHWAELLRGAYPAVTAAYHMNKRHWNTVILDGSIPQDEVLEMIDHSYRLVVKGLSRAERADLPPIA
jgi:predicted DNA-binding protein (MmcQ/YjbR family)